MLTVYAITCTKCNTSVFSRATHDMRGCICGSIAIDGGLDYTKISFDPKMEPPRPFALEVPQTIEELYQDWNTRADKYGLIQPGLVPPPRWVLTPSEEPVENKAGCFKVDPWLEDIVRAYPGPGEDTTLLEEDDTPLTVQKLEGILSKIKDKNTPVRFSTCSGWETDEVDIVFVPKSEYYSEDCLMITANHV